MPPEPVLAEDQFRAWLEEKPLSSPSLVGGFYPTPSSVGVASDPVLPDVEAQLARAYRLNLEEAEKGNAEAEYNVGACFYHSLGVAGNLKEARRWFLKAAKKGVAGAQYNLAFCLENGEGGRQDADEAAVWYRKAAEQGIAKAQLTLALYLANGEGTARDAEQAVVWYRKAAEQGHAEAQFFLANCLLQGEGTARNLEQAVGWYRKAAEQGEIGAQHVLGSLLLEGAAGVPKDQKEGARLTGAAAQQGMAAALERLATYAGEREVANACCLGCGATAALQTCERCLVARFCCKACIARTWPVHTPHCKRWQAEAKAAEGSVE